MTLKRRLFYGSLVITVVLLLGVSFIVIKYMNASASENDIRGKVVWQTTSLKDYDDDGKKDKLVLKSYLNGDVYSNYISLESGLFKKREKRLTGFESDLVFCPQKEMMKRDDELICIFGEVGVHSENIQFLRFNDFGNIKFVDEVGRRSDNMSFDAPYFNFAVDGTGKEMLYFDNRDYDKDPLVDMIRSYYNFDGEVLQFIKKENISMEGSIK